MLFASAQKRRRAIAYYRHSAEDKQENSVEIQRDHVTKFAKENDIDVIHEEADEGVSGLTENRPAFKRMFAEWVENPNAPHFDYVFVYDSSRWGRFQDPDKAAYFAQICKSHGHEVVYINRGFANEKDRLMAHFQSSIDRHMSAEYSRQLSEKVFYGSKKVAEQGYSAGGRPCYGMARLLLNEAKQPIGLLKDGERKVIANQRVSFHPANDKTTAIVKRIFHDLVFRWKEPQDIAHALNQEHVPSAGGGVWTRDKVLRILTNETYTGTHIYNKTWNRLKQGKRPNPRDEWVFCYDAFPSIVDPDVFKEAQERLYLLMPYKRNHGRIVQDRVHRSIRGELRESLLMQGYDEDASSGISYHFPLLSSITFYLGNKQDARWVFMIPEALRVHPHVVALGIALDSKEPLREVFVLPTVVFNSSNFLVMKEGDECYSKYLLRKERIEEKVNALVGEVKERCLPIVTPAST